jgi:hypothetical protein
VHKVDEARLSDTVGDMLSESKGMVYVQSAMGTGKTYQLKRMIRKVCSRGENVLYLIPSLSLHKQLIKDFREMGLNVVDYQDLATEKKEGGNFHKPHVAVCVINSTAKFREGNYSTIVMDESDQCLHNVIRLLESPFDFTKGFSSMLNKADRVIACYAQLSTLSTDYLNSLRKEKGILILNSFKPAEHKTVHMMPTVVSTYKVIRDLLRKEKKLLIVSNSSQETKRIKHLIDEFDLGTRLFLLNDAENSGRIVEFMSDINTQIKDYDVVIASPKLSSGVSIDVDHFDAIVGVYLTANERMGSVLSNVQQLGRARSVTELYVYTAPRVNYFLPTDLKELTRAQKKHTQAYAPSFTANDTGVIVSDVNMYEAYASLHFGSMAMRNLLDQNQQACTEFLLEQQGYQIKKLTKKEAELIVSDGEIKELKELCARVREQVKYEDAQALAYCASIDSETYTKLSMSKYPTKEEKLKCKRFEIEEFIGQKAMPEDIAAWENHLVCKINWLELLNTPEAKVKEDDTKAFEFAREKKKVIEFLSNGARKKFLTIMHSVYFEKDGTPVKEVSLQSPRVTKAVARLKKLSDKVELYRFGSSVASWEKNPMMYINNAMKKMGFIFTVTRRRVVGEIVHFYSCQIDPTLVPYLEQRKEIAATRTSKSAKPFNPSRITSQVSQKYRQLKWKAEDTDATVSMPTPLSRKAAAKQKEAAEKARLMEKAHQKEMEELEELEASEYWADEVFGDEAESCRPNYPSKLKLQTKAQMKAALEKDKRAILLSR